MYLVTLLASARLSYSQQALPTVGHAAWDTLLKEFVNAQHRVDYARLNNGSGRLKDYVDSLEQVGDQPLAGTKRRRC